jgi:hypothetical protein
MVDAKYKEYYISAVLNSKKEVVGYCIKLINFNTSLL